MVPKDYSGRHYVSLRAKQSSDTGEQRERGERQPPKQSSLEVDFLDHRASVMGRAP